MLTRLIFRMLNEAGELLGWTEHMARAKGDGQLWTTGPVSIPIDRRDTVTMVSIHWPDVNVETRVPTAIDLSTLRTEALLIYPGDLPVLRVGPMPDALPPVTVRGHVQVSVPTGSLTALAQA